MGRKDRPGPGWHTVAELAGFFGVARQTFNDSVKKYSAAGESKLVGRTTFYQSRPLLERWAEARHADENGGGAAGPALERLRSEKALIARLERRQLEGKTVDRAVMQNHLQTFATCIRGGIDILQREFGPGAYEIMASAVAQFEKRLGESPAAKRRDGGG